MSPNSICSFVAYFAVKITTLQQHETLMGTRRDLPRRLWAPWPERMPHVQAATCLGKLSTSALQLCLWYPNYVTPRGRPLLR